MHLCEPAWYCLRSQPKHEHIAAANLRQLADVDVFNPRLRVKRSTRKGPLWFTESLFPNYLFARFALQPMLETVRFTSGVKHVVQFGSRWPTIPEEVIADLRQRLGGEETLDQPPELVPGDEVSIIAGPFQGLTAVVQRYMPGAQRVRVLLDVLGQLTSVDLTLSLVTSQRRYPEPLLAERVAA